MKYERLNLVKGDPLSENVFKHFEDSIEYSHNSTDVILNDLYDKKLLGGELVEYFNTYDLPARTFAATFAGWTGYIGTITNITNVKIKFKAVSGYPVSMICIKFLGITR